MAERQGQPLPPPPPPPLSRRGGRRRRRPGFQKGSRRQHPRLTGQLEHHGGEAHYGACAGHPVLRKPLGPRLPAGSAPSTGVFSGSALAGCAAFIPGQSLQSRALERRENLRGCSPSESGCKTSLKKKKPGNLRILLPKYLKIHHLLLYPFSFLVLEPLIHRVD